ncbi:MAG: ribosome maturation factor RimM [Longimicrobiales bacterium]|jgi:16S rRNA processing protein RimM
MGRQDPKFLVVGHVNKPHGTKGELFIGPLTDHPEGIFVPGVVFRLGGKDDEQPDPDLPPLRIETVRPFQNGHLIVFAGVDDRNQADRLRNRYLFVPAEDVAPLAAGEVFFHDLIGMKVETVAGQELGEVAEIFELSPAHMLEVHGEKKEYMIPFTKEVVVEVDADASRLVVDPPDGLLDL